MVQEAGVVVIVCGALWFLVRRFAGSAPEKPPATTFVPIGDLRKKPDQRNRDHCG